MLVLFLVGGLEYLMTGKYCVCRDKQYLGAPVSCCLGLRDILVVDVVVVVRFC